MDEENFDWCGWCGREFMPLDTKFFQSKPEAICSYCYIDDLKEHPDNWMHWKYALSAVGSGEYRLVSLEQ